MNQSMWIVFVAPSLCFEEFEFACSSSMAMQGQRRKGHSNAQLPSPICCRLATNPNKNNPRVSQKKCGYQESVACNAAHPSMAQGDAPMPIAFATGAVNNKLKAHGLTQSILNASAEQCAN